MHTVLNVLLYGALIATVVTLILGFATMLRKNTSDKAEQSNKLMRWRVIFQAIALLVLAILLMTKAGK